MKQADDFRAECNRLESLLSGLDDSDFDRSTGFKSWTINQILRHIHIWNMAAYWQLKDEVRLTSYLSDAMDSIQTANLPAFEATYLNQLSGRSLFEAWQTFYPKMADAYAGADPSKRLMWAGPSMSARSSVTARMMETWAHAQAIYDEIGLDRKSTDAIENIVVLDFNTYGWTFMNRDLPVPSPRPQLQLTAPSGATWIRGDEVGDEWIQGSAEEFCQVVTQCRNIADTDLKVSGPNAATWMRLAQCFAGPPNDPPAPGTRVKRRI